MIQTTMQACSKPLRSLRHLLNGYRSSSYGIRNLQSAAAVAMADAMSQIVLEKKNFEQLNKERVCSLAGLAFLFTHTRPILVSGFRSAIFMAFGDVVAQLVVDEKRVKEIDKERLLCFAGVGLFFVGPSVYLWNGFVQRLLPQIASRNSYKRVLLDNLLFAPPFLYAILYLTGCMRGKPKSEVEADCKNNYKDVLITNFKVWPITQMLSYYVIPLSYQTQILNTVTIMWNAYLSSVCYKAYPARRKCEL